MIPSYTFTTTNNSAIGYQGTISYTPAIGYQSPTSYQVINSIPTSIINNTIPTSNLSATGLTINKTVFLTGHEPQVFSLPDKDNSEWFTYETNSGEVSLSVLNRKLTEKFEELEKENKELRRLLNDIMLAVNYHPDGDLALETLEKLKNKDNYS